MRSHAKKNKKKNRKERKKKPNKDQAKIKVEERSVGGDQIMIRRTQKDIGDNDETMRLFFLNAT